MPSDTPAERKKKKKPGIVASLAARSRALAELGVPGTFATAERLEAGKVTREEEKKKKNNNSSHKSGHKSRRMMSGHNSLHESPFK